MKKIFSAVLGTAMMLGMVACNGGTSKDADPANDSLGMARGYMIGMQMAQQLAMANAQGMAMDTTMFLKGVKDGMSKSADSAQYAYLAGMLTGFQIGQSLNEDKVATAPFLKAFEAGIMGDTAFLKGWSQEDMQTYMQEAEQKLQAKKMEEKFGANKEKGLKFIEEFKKEAGVQTTATGLAYKVLTPAKEGAKKPQPKDRIKVEYKGTLVDGTEFDASNGEPVEFGVTQVIPGWTEMLLLMAEGEKVKVVIPYELAYGEQGAGGDIEPFSTLVFEVTLLQVIPGEQAN